MDDAAASQVSAPISSAPGAGRQRLPQILIAAIAIGILLTCIACCLVLSISDDPQTSTTVLLLGSLIFCFAIIVLPALAMVYLLFFTPEGLRPQQVIDRWSILIDNGQGRREEVVQDLHQRLALLDPPQIMIEERNITSGRHFGIIGERRPFSITSYTGNFRLEPYRMHVSIRDYGNALQTSWYLIAKLTLWQWLLQRFGLLDLDFFEEDDLRGHVTAVHHCFIDAVVGLLTQLGKDTEINRTSKGFLGVS